MYRHLERQEVGREKGVVVEVVFSGHRLLHLQELLRIPPASQMNMI